LKPKKIKSKYFEYKTEENRHIARILLKILAALLAAYNCALAVNDTQGYAAGNELLPCTSIALRTAFRASDMLARIGGDEFAGSHPCTDAATAEQMLARVYDRLNEHNHKFPDLPVCLSSGTSTVEQVKMVEALVISNQPMHANKKLARQAQSHEQNQRSPYASLV
jgi:diguanylate cyclase (GGDEF)-like protein